MNENKVNRQNKGKKSKIITIVAIVLALIISFVGGYFSHYLFNKKSVNVTSDIVRIMQNVGYIIDPETGEEREITEEEIADAIVGVFLDKYSAYYTEEEYQTIKAEGKGNRKGVGVSFFTETPTIDKITGNSPADKAGLKVYDKIISGVFEGGEIEELNTSLEVINFLSSAPDSALITLNVLRANEQKSFSFYKAEYVTSYVTYFDSEKSLTFRSEDANGELKNVVTDEGMKELGEEVAYIRLDQFEGGAVAQMDKALSFMNERGRTKLILDLRDNGGGYVNVMSDIASRLINNGGKGNMVVAYYESKTKTDEFRTGRNRFYSNIEGISVIANQNSASASECLIGAMLCYGEHFGYQRLVIEKGANSVARTYGKGIMQTTYRLMSGGAFKLTTAKILWPDKTCIHDKGIFPISENAVEKVNAITRAVETLSLPIS